MIIILFIIGWLLSKLINKKVFGSERKLENIKDDEKLLLNKLQEVETTHKKIRDDINNKAILINFTNYPNLKKEFEELVNLLVTYNAKHLALKYRYKHSYVSNKYKLEVNRFDEIYANKTGR